MKSQSAVEFMSTYGYAILIITVAIAVLFLYLSLPKTVVPFQCVMYNGFYCTDAALYTFTNNALVQLVVVATDTQPGIVNISAFNAVVNMNNAVNGFCLPSTVQDGQYIYCTANLTFASYPTSVYSGTFNITANYCTNSTSVFYSSYCPASRVYTYGGAVRVQPSIVANAVSVNTIIANAPTTVYYVPITITNTEPVAAPVPFQQEISFAPTSSPVSQYESSDLGNIRFYYGNQELDSWCELNCANSAPANAIFWVRLPFQLQAYSNTVIDMEFLSKAVDYDGLYAGESPNQSVNYGQHDNGQNVFDLYDDFAGPTLSSRWVNTIVNNGVVTTSNGLTLECTGATCNGYNSIAGIESTYNFTPALSSFVVEAVMNTYGSSSGCSSVIDSVNMTGTANITTGSGYGYGYISNAGGSGGGCPLHYSFRGSAGQTVTTSTAQNKYNMLDQQIFLSNGYFEWNWLNYPQYTVEASNSITLPIGGEVIRPTYQVIGDGVGGDTYTSEMNIMFVRVRGYPPAGIMPEEWFSGNVLEIT